MYMEAYGNVGSIADSIIKKSLTALTTQDEAEKMMNEKALSKQGVSPNEEGGSEQATVQPQTDDLASQKAMNSLNKKINDLKARNQYLKTLSNTYRKEFIKASTVKLKEGVNK